MEKEGRGLMSVFGGDSWAREAHYRKRRVDDLLLSSSTSSSTEAAQYRKLSNGKFACLVCPHNPVLDSPLIFSMHMKGSRHITAATRLKEKELSIKEERNKRIALSGDIKDISSSNRPSNKLKGFAVQNKPLIEKTRRILLETHRERIRGHNLEVVCNSAIGTASTTLNFHRKDLHSGQPFKQSQQTSSVVPSENICERITLAVISEWNDEVGKRCEKELQFTAAGWKRDGQGKWYKDENVEFDSDEEDPNVFFN